MGVTFAPLNMLKHHPHRALILWLLSGCLLVYIMVVVGCITRLTHSGLSITDWKLIGFIPPLNEHSWNERFVLYQQSPEYKLVNTGMSVEEFKSIFWWEYIHRLIGMFIGAVFMVGFVILFAKRKINRLMMLKLLVLVALGALQGMIGWWMVKSGLEKNPAVSHYRLAIHLMSAFMVFAFTLWYALELIYPKEGLELTKEGHQLFIPAIVVSAVLILQIVYGAFVAGLKAGMFYPTWPKMGDEWFPEETIIVSNSFVHNFMSNGAGVQFVHRTLAVILCVLVAWFWVKSNKVKLNKQQYKGVTLLIYGITIQFFLGVFTLLYHVPVVMGVLHQTGAFFLFIVAVYLLFHFSRKPSTLNHQ